MAAKLRRNPYAGPIIVAALACAAAGGAAPQSLAPYRDSIPGTLVTFDMVPVPAGPATIETPEGPRTIHVDAFWIGKTEVTWDAYDVFAFRLDLPREQRTAGADAESRPSRPYGAPDWGFGHRGYPVMSVTAHAAAAYTEWLSGKTGRRYRLPTDAEWTRAAELGLMEPVELDPSWLDTLAWHAGNAGDATHPVATKAADALGLHDMLGNVAEWVVSGVGDRTHVRGGSYRDPPGHVHGDARARQTPAWNIRDPQIPKSRWWLSDGPFVGFRLARAP